MVCLYKKMRDDIRKLWRDFCSENGGASIHKIDVFLSNLRKKYTIEKIREFMSKGISREEAINKARQSWVVYVGSRLEQIVIYCIEEVVKKYNAKIVQDKQISRGSKLTAELDAVRRNLMVHFDGYSYLPDADIIVYRNNKSDEKARVLAILSVKNSFRERYTETPYWKIKLSQAR